jgi:hypothetical protein
MVVAPEEPGGNLPTAQAMSGMEVARAWAIADGMAALAAVTLALDLGHYRQAGPYLDLAAHAAHATGSAELEAVLLASRSFVLAYGFGHDKIALEVAELACDVSAGRAHPTTRAWVAAVCSERRRSSVRRRAVEGGWTRHGMR